MGVKDLIKMFQNSAGCKLPERKEKVFMHEKLVVLPRDTDVWSLLHDYVTNMNPLHAAKRDEFVKLFAKSLKEEIKRSE